MITNLTLKAFERMHDWKIAGVVATVGRDFVSERTVRNWLGQHTAPDVQLLAQITAASHEKLRANLKGNAWPPEESQAFVDALQACPGS